MTEIVQTVSHDPIVRSAGGFAIASGIVSAVGIVFLIVMYVFFLTSNQEQGSVFGLVNDILVALQYMLTIPVAIALYRILQPQNPTLVLVATIVGIAAMLVVIVLQVALVFEVLTFQQQAVWTSLTILGGVGSWLIITGVLAKSIGGFSNSVLMSAIAVPYFGFPAWAIWLGRILLGWG